MTAAASTARLAADEASADPGDIGTGVFYALPGDAAAASFRAHAADIGVIAPQSFSLDGYGQLKGSVPADLQATAQAAGVAMMPLVINAGFSRTAGLRLLRDAGARDRAIGALVAQGMANGVEGWQIDFENLPSYARALFTRFVTEAADALHRHGMQLSVAVAARTNDDPSGDNYRDFSGVYDYAGLAASADFLSVMAYPESDASHPGPLAGTPWVEQVIAHVLTQVPADKISLGLPTYQTDWMERRVRITIRRRIAGKIRRVYRYIYRLFHHNGPVTVDTDALDWDPVMQTSYRIRGSGHDLHITWVEDQRSFAAKLRLVAEYHLRGYSVWRIGLEDPNIWDELPPIEREARSAPAPDAAQPVLVEDSLQP